MHKYKTLLFDVDGTLLDFHDAEKQALKNTFLKYHIPLTNEIKDYYIELNNSLWKQFELGLIDKNTVVYTRFVKLFQHFGINEDGIKFEDVYQEELGKGYKCLPYAKEILKQLFYKYELYVVTNGVSKTQYSRLKESGLDIYFKDIFVSEDAGYQKPKKEYFDYCFERIDSFDKKRTLIIGDSLSSDIKGGFLAGIDTCWITNSHNKSDMATYTINNLKEIYEILKEK